MSDPLGVSQPAGTAGLVLVEWPDGKGVSLCYRTAAGVREPNVAIIDFQDYGEGIFAARTVIGAQPHLKIGADGRLFLAEG